MMGLSPRVIGSHMTMGVTVIMVTMVTMVTMGVMAIMGITIIMVAMGVMGVMGKGQVLHLEERAKLGRLAALLSAAAVRRAHRCVEPPLPPLRIVELESSEVESRVARGGHRATVMAAAAPSGSQRRWGDGGSPRRPHGAAHTTARALGARCSLARWLLAWE
jgi:hypothetical protein